MRSLYPVDSFADCDFRQESDSIGTLMIPKKAYWGIHTARAVQNFDIARRPISVYADFLRSFAQIKQAAARANVEIGALDATVGGYIDQACQDIIDGKLRDEFIVGVIQGGAGTSANMNFNEVIANRALELAGRCFADYDYISPNDHVNCSQSTNDTYPSAVKLAIFYAINNLLLEHRLLQDAFLKRQ